MGERKQTKGGVGGRPKSPCPRRVPPTPAAPATPGARPPPGTTTAGRASAARVQPQGCRGRSPRRNKLIVSPFPTGEGGRGDRGQESKPKAGWAGEEKGKPPFGHRKPPPTHHVTPQKKTEKSPEPRIRADSGQSQSYSGIVPGARGTLSKVPRRFSFLSTDPKPCHQGDPGWSRRRGTPRRGVQAPARGGG